MDDDVEHAVTRRTALVQQLSNAAGDLKKISVVGDYAMLDNLCKSRTQFPKRKCNKDLRVHEDRGGKMKSTHQILPRVGVPPGLPADRSVDHRHQRSGYLDDRNPAHKSGSDKPRQIADDAAS